MSEFELPVTHYALSGDINIAYQTMGEGPTDIILVPGFMSHIEFMHELPGYTAFLRHLSTFTRVVTFDKRGHGLSDRVSDAPSLEQRMDDSCRNGCCWFQVGDSSRSFRGVRDERAVCCHLP